MKKTLAALVIFGLFLFLIGCDKNDENTVNSIPKYHNVYPVFALGYENGYKTFGIDSVKLTVNPDIGWTGDVYSNVQGQIPTLSAGTFVLDIDTIIEVDPVTSVEDTIIDTSWQNFGFAPSAAYTFTFNRSVPYVWIDSFRINYATTIDSFWRTIGADTTIVSKALDLDKLPNRRLDSVRVITNPASTTAESTYVQHLLKGFWFDSSFVITDPNDTIELPPDSTKNDSLIWGFWFKTDSFFLPRDSSLWCELTGITTRVTPITDINGNVTYIVDSIYHYGNCSTITRNTGVYTIDSIQYRIYRQRGWSNYDTTVHFTFPDTLKRIDFTGGAAISVATDINGTDTTWGSPVSTSITLIKSIKDIRDTTALSDLNVPLTMPPVEVYPEYKIIFDD